MHKIVEGSASRSYGIHVAKLAGVPQKVLDTARNKLFELESNTTKLSVDHNSDLRFSGNSETLDQLSWFDFISNPVLERLRALDLMELTPSQAFSILEELKNAAK